MKQVNGQTVQVGQRVHCILNGTMSLSTPECLVRGSVEWRIYDNVVSIDEVNKAIENVEITINNKTNEKAIEKAKFDDAVLQLQNDPQWEHLDKENAKKQCGGKYVATQIRVGLKKLYPNLKFSIRSDYSSVTIGWTDGPTESNVKKFTNLFINSEFDSYTDYSNAKITPWNVTFGGCQYVSCNRDVSDDAIEKAIDMLFQKSCLKGNLSDIDRPSVGSVRRCDTLLIPHISNIYMHEAVLAISRVLDTHTEKISYEGYHNFSWLFNSIKD